MAPRNGAADGRQRAARAVAVRRGEMGMTQQQLADKAGVDVKTVGSLETRGRWPIARSRVSIERALDWPSGEMDRIAAAPGPAPQPRVPADVLAVIKKNYPPERQREIIEKLEAIEREQRGEWQSPPPAQSAG